MKHVCIVSGFQNKIQALQFECEKHHPPRNVGGINSRLKVEKSSQRKWTSKSLSCDVPLPWNIKMDGKICKKRRDSSNFYWGFVF